MTAPALPIPGTGGDDDLNGTDDSDFYLLDQGGTDRVWGGAGDDSFYFGAQWTWGDSVDGGTGNDMVILQGNCSVDLQSAITGVEMLVLMSAADTRFGASGAGSSFYMITAADETVAAGQTLTIQGNRLGANEAVHFVGYLETDGNFRFIGGAGSDSFYGGAGADVILGGLGADQMDGLGGDDIFVYRSTAESSAAAADLISGFEAGDRIDLRLIDADTGSAGDQAFTFIGSDEFHGVAGELRAFQMGAGWSVQGDTDGDGFADFVIGGFLGTPPLDALSYYL